MKRIFIAIKIVPEAVLSGFISQLRQELKDERISWTPAENIHITLAFLGDTDEETIRIINKMLAGVCQGHRRFRFTLKGAGVFRNLSDPRVLWTGIEHSEAVFELQDAIKAGLGTCGISIEDRKFNPHLTLGRIKSIRNIERLASLIEKHRSAALQSVEVNEIVLFESILMQNGAVYRPLSLHSLAPDNNT